MKLISLFQSINFRNMAMILGVRVGVWIRLLFHYFYHLLLFLPFQSDVSLHPDSISESYEEMVPEIKTQSVVFEEMIDDDISTGLICSIPPSS